MLANWRKIILTCNAPDESKLDPVSKWLVLTRACVFSMTLTSGLIGLLLALVRKLPVDGWAWALATVGILIAHATNNIMNDLQDAKGGVDTEDYPRALYAPHPILSGWTTRRELTGAALLLNLLGLAIGIALIVWKGLPVLWFMLAGFLLSFFYTAPPLRLKHYGLGEPTVLLVWGPLMIGGVHYVATGQISWPVILASIPYGITVTSVLMGKHLDKYPWDAPKGVHTLPVVLGYGAAKAVTVGMWIAAYVVIAALVALGTLWWGVFVLYLLSLPRLVRTIRMYRGPKPESPPEPQFERTWPLYYVSIAFWYNRLAGGLFVLGLVADLLVTHFAPGLHPLPF